MCMLEDPRDASTLPETLSFAEVLDAPFALEEPEGPALAGTPYAVVRRVGQGGMGEVYEAEHRALGRRAAVKVLHQRHVDRPDLAARLRGEARLLGRLRHPNLVDVFDLGVTADGRPWFAMPLLFGRDLREELARSGCLTPERAASLVGQALAGLGAAHAAGLVHRDIKLENLFLEHDGTVKVLDFGIAKATSGGGAFRTDPATSPGTPRTMAPEQCAREPVDSRTDLYAVGLCLYELLAGRGPFDDARGSADALRFAHARREPAPPSAFARRPIPAALDRVVLTALAKSPADRFQSAAEMAGALAASVAPLPAVPLAPSRRSPAASFVALSAAALALVALALTLVTSLAAR